MKTNVALLVVMILVPVIHTSKGNYTDTRLLTQREQTLRYNFDYTCNGERVVVNRCRKDSDLPGVRPTQPNDDYCLVYYPDRPKQGGFVVQTSELRSDLIKKLKACGAFNADGQKVERNTQVQGGQNTGIGTLPKRPSSRFTGQTWEYRVDEAPTYAGPGSFIEPTKSQQLLNQRAAEGWQLIPFVRERLFYFKRAK
jgi:hypothetical protein